MSTNNMDFDKIMHEITSGLTGNRDTDFEYLKEQMELYKDHEMSTEILRACGRLLYEVIPEDKKEALSKVLCKDEISTKAVLEEANFNIYKKNFKKALKLVESLVNRVEELNMFKDDQVSEYHTLNEPFEEILYDFKNKPGKKLRQASEPFSEIYLLYGNLLVEFKRFEEARIALKKALRWNPIDTKAYFEYTETYKMTGDFETFFNLTKAAFGISYRATAVARCYRNLGYYFVEKELYPEAVGCYLMSMQFEPDAKQVQSELYYINNKAKRTIPDPSMEELKGFAEKYGFPIQADDDIVGLSYSYGKHFLETNQKDYAKYFLTITYELTDMESVKELLEKLDE